MTFLERHAKIERSIIKTYRKELWSKFTEAVRKYKLVDEGDHIMVCISGGKDSFLLAKLLEELKKHGKKKIDLEYVVMDPGYTKETLKKIEENAEILNLPINVFKTDIFAVTHKISKDSPCYMCARMRRGYLYNKASELGCNKIALGHHFDDVIETTLLSILYGAEIKTMVPKVKSKNFEGLTLIRPMYFIKEHDILKWVHFNRLEFINCACDFTKEKDVGKRVEIKNLIANLRKVDPAIDHNIFKSMENVNIDCTIGFKYRDKSYNFDDIYERNDIK